MSYMPYDPGGLVHAPDVDDALSDGIDGAASIDVAQNDRVNAPRKRKRAQEAEHPCAALVEQLRGALHDHGLKSLLKALLRLVPRDELLQTTVSLCNQRWGEEPVLTDDGGNEGDSAASSRYRYKRCWHCEPMSGPRASACAALKVLDALEDEFIEKDEGVLQAEQPLFARQEGKEEGVRRAARYYMYRKWVWEKHGRLGKANRVRIPPCVVEYIRNRYREPNCTCLVGGELYRCKEHGYTGHRDLPPPEE